MVVCLITGASRGIGAAVARRAARAGYAVAVTYVQAEAKARAVVAEIESAGGRAVAFQADVGDPAQVKGLFAAVAERLGPVTALINNAGLSGGRHALAELAPATLRRVLDVNLAGPILCMAEAVGQMSTRQGGAGGAIVNVSSQAVQTGGHLLTSYVAAKAGLEALTAGLARELGPDGIRVNAVSPGIIATDQQPLDDAVWQARMRATIPLGRLGTPEEVAELIVWLLSPASSYVNGAVISVTGGR